MWPFKRRVRQPAQSALLDVKTNILLALDINPAVVVFLKEVTSGSYPVHAVNYLRPNEPFPLAHARQETYPYWTFDWEKKHFASTDPAAVTNELKERSRLALAKGAAIEKVMRNLSIARYPVSSGVLFQESVYSAKRQQAEEFKRTGYPENDSMAYPYVVQYADFEDLSLAQAADEIIFRAKLDEDILAKTEILRLKYFNKVKAEKDLLTLPSIVEEFMQECFGVAIKP